MARAPVVEKVFPRGGKKEKKKHFTDADFSLFKKQKAKIKNEKGLKNRKLLKQKPCKKIKTALLDVADLQLSDVRPGMSIMGCVDKITDCNVQLALPGSLRALVSAANISNKYRSLIESNGADVPTLDKIFQLGQHWPVSVLEHTPDSPCHIAASLNPRDVNAKLSYAVLQKGLVLTGSVSSVEEHGVVIDIGIPNAAAFMKLKNKREEMNYLEGQLIQIKIESLGEEGRAIYVKDVGFEKELSSIKEQLPMHCLVAGSHWNVIVTKTLKNGLEVAIKNYGPDVKGYIHKNFITNLFDNVENYSPATKMDVVLLYMLPIVNTPYFAMVKREQPKWSLPYGSLVSDVHVESVEKSGIYGKICVNGGFEKCFIPSSRVKEKESFESYLLVHYPVGTVLPLVRIEWPSRLCRFYFGAIDHERTGEKPMRSVKIWDRVDPVGKEFLKFELSEQRFGVTQSEVVSCKWLISVKRASLNQKMYSKSDLRVGQVVKCRISVVGTAYCTVEIGRKVKGYIASYHMTDIPGHDITKLFKTDMIVKARVLSLGGETDRVRLTLKPTLVKTNRVLSKESEVKPGEAYPGTISKIFNRQIAVEFFGNRFETIDIEGLPVSKETPLSSAYRVGQLVNCYVAAEEDGRLSFTLNFNSNLTKGIKLWKEYKVTVTGVTDDGVEVDLEIGRNRTCPGFIPKPLISSNPGIASLLIEVYGFYATGEKISALCIQVNPLSQQPCILTTHPTIMAFSARTKNLLKRGKNILRSGRIIPFVIIPKKKKFTMFPMVPIPPSVSLPYFRTLDKQYHPYQVIMGKIKSASDDHLVYSTELCDVWDHQYMSSLKMLSAFVEECWSLQEKLPLDHPLYGLKIGQTVEGTVMEAGESGCVIKLNEKTTARCHTVFRPKSSVKGRVVWIDYRQRMPWVQLFKDNGPVFYQEKKSIVKARVIHVCQDVIVADVSTSRELLFIPTRRHINESITYEEAYNLGEKSKFSVHRLGSRLFGLDRKIVLKAEKRIKPQVEVPLIPENPGEIMKDDDKDADIHVEFAKEMEKTLENQEIKQERFSDEGDVEIEAPSCEDDDSEPEIKSEFDSEDGVDDLLEPAETLRNRKEEEEGEIPNLDLAVGFDWSVDNNPMLLKGALSRAIEAQSSSDDEDEGNEPEKKKQKRLTGSEKREKAREAEERLRERETQLIEATRIPQSADDFDRLVASTPDDSTVWLKYMAFHLENTEIEKARAVARRALKVISFREEQEKLNVWFALLNLEQSYGTAESQKQTLDEALRCNEPFKIHIHKLGLLVDFGAGLEAEKLGNAMLRKYKENESVWCEVGAAMMRSGRLECARSVLQRAMASLPKSRHVALVAKFAQLENKFGSNERAQTLYETILTTFPKRVDVWSAYVDLMVKSNRIDLARQILDRSVSLSLPPRKMKVLYKKFISFEETFGTHENAERVRQLAAEYCDWISKSTEQSS